LWGSFVLWRDADFRRLWVGQTASQLGEQTSLVILPLLAVLTFHVGAGELGVLRAVGQAPQLLLPLFVGVWVDRWQTRTVMVLADLGRAVVLGLFVVGGLGLPALVVVAFVVGALSVFFDVAYQASMIRLVSRDRLVRGNSAIEGSRSAAQIGGPALGGAMVSLLSGPLAAAATALFFLGSVVSIGRIRQRETVDRIRGGMREGLRFVAGHRLLRTICLASAAFQFFLAATMTSYLLFLPRERHLSGAAIGLALAGIGPGALAGSLLVARLRGRFLVAAAAIGDGVFLLVPVFHSLTALIAINFVFGALGQLVNVTVMAIRQAVTPDRLQGRVAATITFAGMGTTPLGSLAGGYLADQWGLRTALLVTAAGMLLSPALMACSPLRTLREIG
jgi:MFS family permease